MKLYRQVPVTERLPEKHGFYITNDGYQLFADDKFIIGYDSEILVRWWMEELPELPTEEELKEKWPDRNGSGTYMDGYVSRREGANYIINLIKSK